ncbi:hypothetical protein PENPOL_c002G10241 [Penicillium polonicum]|uniref:C3H1-type domain-containing protein n=1 Tax=Penicillium polonicum TaxID=60169 RepID=A0A1V6NXE7_PENPO|nr:hypothetical protein PENPOL_c002G10241 [Penicillium polonicum]
MLEQDGLRKRYEAVKIAEDNKDKITEELFIHVQSLQEALQQEKNESEDQKRLVRFYREDVKRCKSELEEKDRMEARLSFVLVLVDGDHMNFMDELVRDGQKGGRSAAKALIEAAREHVREVKPDSNPNVQFKIRVYANVAGLAKTYSDTGIVSSADTLRSFIQGFNMHNTLCDFVDAGNGKECSDVKVAAHFEHYLHDVHCQHIIFCGSADNGYARVLGPHGGSNYISLVEGPPFARELRDLATEFKTTSFPSVFRLKKLSRRVSFGSKTIAQAITPPRTPTSNYASVARTATLVSEDSSTLTSAPIKKSIPNSPMLVVQRNVNGERVDGPLHYSTRAKLDVLKQHKFCNQFHILGSCSYGEDCNHRHEPRLADQEVIDLMWIARLSPCSKGLRCDDKRCVSGHRCPRENCTVKGCKFPHEVDIRIVASL